MRSIRWVIVMGCVIPFVRGERRANFLHITVRAERATSLRAMWHPYAGAVGTGDAQQAALQRRWPFKSNADSVARWRDSSARDTIVVTTPGEFVVDMTDGPVVIESLADSVRIEAQLMPARGPLVAVWAKAAVVESDGRTPHVTRRR